MFHLEMRRRRGKDNHVTPILEAVRNISFLLFAGRASFWYWVGAMSLWPRRAGLEPRKTTEASQQVAGLRRRAAEFRRHFAFKTDGY